VAILAGGRGERFWPLSTPDTPKQFLALGGGGPFPEPGRGAGTEPLPEPGQGPTLLRQAAWRADGLAPWADRVVVAGRAHASLVRAQLAALPPANLILEPAGRDTAGAIALACAWALRPRGQARAPAGGGRLLVMPADHAVPDAAAFRAAVQIGLRVLDAHPDALVTLGIEPTRPETGYGYILAKEPVAGVPGASWALRFTEKPDGATAERFLREGGYRWNSGIFLWEVAAIREALRRYLPAHASLVDRLAGLDPAAWPPVLETEFLRLPKISIDYGVMEKASTGLSPGASTGLSPGTAAGPGPGAPRVAVVAATFAWDDLGAWNALPRLVPPDASGNVVRGPARLVDVEDCIVVSSGRPIGALGVRGLVMVEGPGGVLVCPRERAQEVRRLAEGE
jgi:mannose-1-phosphate guanylyltransferase